MTAANTLLAAGLDYDLAYEAASSAGGPLPSSLRLTRRTIAGQGAATDLIQTTAPESTASDLVNMQVLLPLLTTTELDEYGRPISYGAAPGADVEVLQGHGPGLILGRRAPYGQGAPAPYFVEDLIAAPNGGIIMTAYGFEDYTDDAGVTWPAPGYQSQTRRLYTLQVDPLWITSGASLPSPIPLSYLVGITTSQLSASAGIQGSQLAASAGILGSQLSVAAGIVRGQIASVNASAVVGTILSGNLPADVAYLDAAQTFTLAQIFAAATGVPATFEPPNNTTGAIGITPWTSIGPPSGGSPSAGDMGIDAHGVLWTYNSTYGWCAALQETSTGQVLGYNS